MQKIYKNNITAVIVSLAITSGVMMTLEYINSKFYPLPTGLNTMDIVAVRAFTESLPWNAYILVILGWLLGSMAGAYLLQKYGREDSRVKNIKVLVIILTLLGLLNNLMLGAHMLMTIIGLAVFYLGAKFGSDLAKKR